MDPETAQISRISLGDDVILQTGWVGFGHCHVFIASLGKKNGFKAVFSAISREEKNQI